MPSRAGTPHKSVNPDSGAAGRDQVSVRFVVLQPESRQTVFGQKLPFDCPMGASLTYKLVC